jgi:hypothetical protein
MNRCNDDCDKCRRQFCIDLEKENEFWEIMKENYNYGYKMLIEEINDDCLED